MSITVDTVYTAEPSLLGTRPLDPPSHRRHVRRRARPHPRHPRARQGRPGIEIGSSPSKIGISPLQLSPFFTIFAANKRKSMESILIIVVSVAITALLFGIPKGKPKKKRIYHTKGEYNYMGGYTEESYKPKKSKYDWSLKGFFNDPTGDVVHFPSKKRRR